MARRPQGWRRRERRRSVPTAAGVQRVPVLPTPCRGPGRPSSTNREPAPAPARTKRGAAPAPSGTDRGAAPTPSGTKRGAAPARSDAGRGGAATERLLASTDASIRSPVASGAACRRAAVRLRRWRRAGTDRGPRSPSRPADHRRLRQLPRRPLRRLGDRYHGRRRHPAGGAARRSRPAGDPQPRLPRRAAGWPLGCAAPGPAPAGQPGGEAAAGRRRCAGRALGPRRAAAARLGRAGPVQVLQPVLLAWVQLGRGQTDAGARHPAPAGRGQPAARAERAACRADRRRRQPPARCRALRPHGAGRPAQTRPAAGRAGRRRPGPRRPRAGGAAPAGPDRRAAATTPRWPRDRAQPRRACWPTRGVASPGRWHGRGLCWRWPARCAARAPAISR